MIQGRTGVGVLFVLFAICVAKQESLGFSAAKLVFGHNVHGPLKVLKEQFMSGSFSKTNVLDFVSQCRESLHCVSSLAKAAFSSSQDNMKSGWTRKRLSDTE